MQKRLAKAFFEKLAEGADDARVSTETDPDQRIGENESPGVLHGLLCVAAGMRSARALAAEGKTCLLEDALTIYYIAEDLARDPANAELLPFVEKIRKAHEREFGKPIPAKG